MFPRDLAPDCQISLIKSQCTSNCRLYRCGGDSGSADPTRGRSGSYHVQVNLTRCAMWFMSLGVLERDAIQAVGEEHQFLNPDTIIANILYDELVRLAPPVKFSETNGFWEDSVVTVRGSCKPEWK